MWAISGTIKPIYSVLQSDKLSCYVIDAKHGLQAYAHFEIPSITDGVIHNISSLEEAFYSFVQTNKLRHAYNYLVLCKPLMQEQFIQHADSGAQLNDLIKTEYHAAYHYRYIGPHHNQFLFYLASMPQSLLLQLKIVHHKARISLQEVRSPLSAQHELYTACHGAAISQGELVQMLDKETIEIKNIASHPYFKQYIPHDLAHEYNETFLYALGSFIGSKDEIY